VKLLEFPRFVVHSLRILSKLADHGQFLVSPVSKHSVLILVSSQTPFRHRLIRPHINEVSKADTETAADALTKQADHCQCLDD
jgi:hypothetical protein